MTSKNPFAMLDLLADEWYRNHPPPKMPPHEDVEKFFQKLRLLGDELLDLTHEVEFD